MAKIDIVIPCYNYGRYLDACVSSVLSQSLDDIRVLILDDASTDETPEVAAVLAASDRRVALVSHPKNIGHIQTYNEGIAWANSEYFMLLSADDLLAPGALERAAAVLDADADVLLTHGGCAQWEDGRPLPEWSDGGCSAWTREDGLDLVASYCRAGSAAIDTPTVIARTQVQKAIGGYRPHLPHAGDMEMWLRFAANGAVGRIHTVQAFKRVHGANMANAYYKESLRDWEQRKLAFESFLQEYWSRLPDPLGLQAHSHRALAETAFYIGVAKICRGEVTIGRRLLGFALELRPTLRYWQWPAIARLARTPRLHLHMANVLVAGVRHRLRADG